jgi:uncharacterized oxidoreductase
MLTILLDPAFFASEDDFAREAQRFIAYVKSSERVDPENEILMPGEMEERTRARRVQAGIELDATTWEQIVAVCRSLNVSPDVASQT